MTGSGELTGGTPAARLAVALAVAAEAGDNAEVLRLLATARRDAELAASCCGVLACTVAGLARQLAAAQAALSAAEG